MFTMLLAFAIMSAANGEYTRACDVKRGNVVPTEALGRAPPRVLDEDPAHGLGGHPEEVGPVLEGDLATVGQPQPGLVDQGRGLEGVLAPLPHHVVRRHLPQLVVDEVPEVGPGRGVPRVHPSDETGDVRRWRRRQGQGQPPFGDREKGRERAGKRRFYSRIAGPEPPGAPPAARIPEKPGKP